VRSTRRLRTCAALAAALLACVHDVHRIGPIAAPGPRRPPAVRVLVFGDFGNRTLSQWLTARAMHRAHAARPFDLAIQLGDNLYYCGPDPTLQGAERCRFEKDGATVATSTPTPDDPIFGVNEGPLAGFRGPDGTPIPIYLVLGNHDVSSGGRCAAPGLPREEAERRRACLSVAHRTPTWSMPARHYVLDRGPLRIVGIDTNVVVGDYGGFTLEDEIAFLREAIAPCVDGRICVIAGHHPPAVVHWYGRRLGPSPHGVRMARLLQAAEGKARAFFAGHVHALEHLTLDGLEVFVSGSTAMAGLMPFRIQSPARAQLRFATSAWGYATLEVDARGYRVDFFDFQGVPLHCCEAATSGPCRPVTCG
jgi:3',5'-cyclic AMP phosphodiesterase CpdA